MFQFADWPVPYEDDEADEPEDDMGMPMIGGVYYEVNKYDPFDNAKCHDLDDCDDSACSDDSNDSDDSDNYSD
ncbi:hypothetical protein HPB52_018753 [Rhipicephalus sanguineus]|uniref:Uncharacterized protein n=1 Tax=Rhipicephalus sanguineus TaxID=34632 RepID=A0A9D4T479_RHISA|nr:hypothetical protein HPB52_018753 [Rhipicephalus sanguineus]